MFEFYVCLLWSAVLHCIFKALRLHLCLTPLPAKCTRGGGGCNWISRFLPAWADLFSTRKLQADPTTPSDFAHTPHQCMYGTVPGTSGHQPAETHMVCIAADEEPPSFAHDQDTSWGHPPRDTVNAGSVFPKHTMQFYLVKSVWVCALIASHRRLSPNDYPAKLLDWYFHW